MFLRLLFSVLALAAVFAASADVRAQSDELQQAYRAFQAAFDAGDYPNAEKHARNALNLGLVEFGEEHETIVLLLNNLAMVYRAQGRYDEAEPLFKRGLTMVETIFGREHASVIAPVNNLAALYQALGRYNESEHYYKRSLAIAERTLGPDHVSVAMLVGNLAETYREQGRYAEAEPLYQRGLDIAETALGPGHASVATLLNNLALLHKAQGRYAEAVPSAERSLAIAEDTLGAQHPNVATLAHNLASLYQALARYRQAEPLYKRSLTIAETSLGPEHPDLATYLSGLAELYEVQVRYGEAEQLYERSLTIREKALGSQHPAVAVSLSRLAKLHSTQGRYAIAEPLYRRSLAIREAVLGPQHAVVATSLSNLARLLAVQGRYAEAEPLDIRSLAIREKTLGTGHPDVARSLNNLSALFHAQRRYAEAEPLARRSLAIAEKTLGDEHPLVATSLNTLAELYRAQGRYGEAEPLYKRSLAITEKAFGPEHPDMSTSLNNLAGSYWAQGRYAAAEPLYRRSLSLAETAFGPEHPHVIQSFINLAANLHAQERHAEAEPLYRHALATSEKALGPEHPHLADILNNLAVLYRAQGRHDQALGLMRRVSAILRQRFATASYAETSGGDSERKGAGEIFRFAVGVTLDPLAEPNRRRGIAEAFGLAQRTQTSGAGKAVQRMAARFAAGDDDLASLVRERQDAVDRSLGIDAALIAAASQRPETRNAQAEEALREEKGRLVNRLDELTRTLANRFPRFAEVASPQPLDLPQTQGLLSGDEALVVILRGYWREETTHVFVVRSGMAEAYSVEISGDDISAAVDELREGIDLGNVASLGDLPRFDTRTAYDLYNALLAPAEPYLRDIKHLFVVTDGALTSIPLGLLVTEPQAAPPLQIGDYAGIPWLARRFAVTVLPSVSSLKALRIFAARARASKPFTGFGDPALSGGPGNGRGSIKFASLMRGALADVDRVRDLPGLPDTADELHAVARTLGVPTSEIYLRDQATEQSVKAADLAQYRVVSFATHGLVAGELQGLPEPGLVLTPPARPSETDDGVLMASEIAQLKLNADWVVLSACNTAAGDEPGAEGLSGLAKAFFYAGARTLLVSHWPVSSDATVGLITTLFETAAENTGIGRAEALRRARIAMMTGKDHPHFAHPAFWAPFVVVGEGGTYRPSP